MIRIPEEQAPTDAHKSPTEPLKNRLSSHVLSQPFERMVSVAITFHRKASPASFDHQVDSVVANTPLGLDAIPFLNESFQNSSLESQGPLVNLPHFLF
ncbi:MAG: hypothetical protein EWM72_03241 [Nitrospira sp.]|nr:MAG: hypothetical protein EWM72_03241 [Nitrospira sp.]